MEKFCDNNEIQTQIIDFLTTNLLGNELRSELECRYNDMRNNYDCINTEWSFTTEHKRFEPLETSTSIAVPICLQHYSEMLKDCSAIGVDLPTWYNMNSQQKKIMFIAQDPLRSKDYYGGKKGSKYICNDIILSSPFGTHDKIYRESRFGKLYFSIFQELISQDYGVYLTDINKFYVGVKSTSFKSSQLKDDFQKMLEKEIEIIKPDLIVTFGGLPTRFFSQGKSWSWFESFESKEFKILPMVHPSPAARGTGELKILLKEMGAADQNLIDKYVELIENKI